MTLPHFTMPFCRAVVGALWLSLMAFATRAEEATVHTGWLELVKGSRDSTVGAELVEIETGDKPGMQTLTLAIPKKSIANPDAIEEVVVMGQPPEEPDKPELLDMTYEWVKDYDSDNYGLVIRLSRNTNWPIRLYMNSDPDSAD